MECGGDSIRGPAQADEQRRRVGDRQTGGEGAIEPAFHATKW
jgi:hypothetical protein